MKFERKLFNKNIIQAFESLALPVNKIYTKYRSSEKDHLDGVFFEISQSPPYKECFAINKTLPSNIFQYEVLFRLWVSFSFYKSPSLMTGPYEIIFDLMDYLKHNNQDIAEYNSAGWYILGKSENECGDNLLKHFNLFKDARAELMNQAINVFSNNYVITRALELAKGKANDDKAKENIMEKLQSENLYHSKGYVIEYVAREALKIVQAGLY